MRPDETIHLADAPQGLIQRCLLCGAIIDDKRDQVSTDDHEVWWPEGEPIAMKDSGGGRHAPGEESNCTEETA